MQFGPYRVKPVSGLLAFQAIYNTLLTTVQTKLSFLVLQRCFAFLHQAEREKLPFRANSAHDASPNPCYQRGFCNNQ